MIHAAYTQFRDEDGKLVLRLSAEGHAGAATEGGDIVCAAVSALMQTLGNRAEGAAMNGGAELFRKTYCKAENCFEVVTRATEKEEQRLLAWYEFAREGLAQLARDWPERVELEEHFGETEEEETE